MSDLIEFMTNKSGQSNHLNESVHMILRQVMMNPCHSGRTFESFDEGFGGGGLLFVVDGAVTVGKVVDAGRQHFVVALADHRSNGGL